MKLVQFLIPVIFLFSTFSFAQKSNATLTEVDSLLRISQPNEAQKTLWSILKASKNQKNDTMLIKTVTYFSKILYPLENEEKATLYFVLQDTVQQFSIPVKSLANLYLLEQMVYNRYQWFSYGRLSSYDTLNLANDEIRFKWIMEKVNDLEKNLIKLQKFDFSPYQNTFLKGNDTLHFARTVADYVAYRLIDIYQSADIRNGGGIKQNSVPDSNWYAMTNKFQSLELSGNSLTSRILRLYQFIEKNNNDFLQFSSVTVYQRLQFLKDKYPDSVYFPDIWKQAYLYFERSSARSKFLYEMAKSAYQLGITYHYKTHQEVEKSIKLAYDILKKELKNYPKNDFKEEMKNLLHLITAPEISFHLPNITATNRKIPLLVNYKAYKDYYLRIFRVKQFNPTDHLSLNGYVKANRLEKIKIIPLHFQQNDLYQLRGKEMLLGGLKKLGNYYFVFSKDTSNLYLLAQDSKKWQEYGLSATEIVVSNINISHTFIDDNFTVLVVNQKDGKAVKNASVQLFEYNYKTKGNWKKITDGTTDKDGLFSYHNSKGYHNYRYIVRSNGSVLMSNTYHRVSNNSVLKKMNLFTDRAVYRPGQTVYFKGVLYLGAENEFAVQPKKKVTIKIQNASYQVLFKEKYITNDYGSINGSFTLPDDGLLGVFSIIAEFDGKRQSTRFHVEEYKRPTYKLKLNQPTALARLNDTIRLSGSAIALAGYPINGAKVTYTIYRKWNKFWFYRLPNYSGGDLLLTDTTLTDEKGEFAIQFMAATDPNAEAGAYYYYQIKAKVTDINGETHEVIRNLTLNSTGLATQLVIPSSIYLGKTDTTKAIVSVVNMAGELQSNYKGKLYVYKMTEQKKFLPRIWENQQFSSINSKEMIKLYPYRVINTYMKFTKEALVATIAFHSGDTILTQDWFNKQQGKYIIKAVVIHEMDTITTEKSIVVIDNTSKSMPYSGSLWTTVSKSDVKVGETFTVQIGSSFKDAKALAILYGNNGIVLQQWITLNERTMFTYSPRESDRGGLILSVVLSYNGQFYREKEHIDVPFDNKKLTIKAATFRDKLIPGEKETWQFTIENRKQKLANIEMAAVMYDVALDAFYPQNWNWSVYQNFYTYRGWKIPWNGRFNNLGNRTNRWPYYASGISRRHYNFSILEDRVVMEKNVGIVASHDKHLSLNPTQPSKNKYGIDSEIYTSSFENKEETKTAFIPRSNFNETAFFYPTIYANDSNKYKIQFTLPESLTKWKLMLLAHSKDMKVGELNRVITAKKKLMITANAPRFVRRGDTLYFSAKVVNLTDSLQMVKVNLLLQNPVDQNNLNTMIQGDTEQSITLSSQSSKEVRWELVIGAINILQYTIKVQGANFSDGERNVLPVLSNRTLITEAQHKIIRDDGITHIDFLPISENTSESLKNEAFTVTYIDNLAWNAIMALPSMMKGNDRSVTGIMHQYYANALTQKILKDHPKIATIIKTWKEKNPEELMSELQNNDELKAILLNESPWVLAAKNETEQRGRIAQLFALNQTNNRQQTLFMKLQKRQNTDGGFSWFEGGQSNVYITQYILTQIGHLKNLQVDVASFSTIAEKAMRFVDRKKVMFYQENIKKYDKNKTYQLSEIDIQWLYTKALLSDLATSDAAKEVVTFYHSLLSDQWTNFNPFGQALIGIITQKLEQDHVAQLIYTSLQDRAHSNELGMYWVENTGWYWYENKISTQAMIINFFKLMDAPKEMMNNARIWLILNKETNHWNTGSESVEAIYAILSTGGNYLKPITDLTLKIGSEIFTYGAGKQDWTAGKGQFKKRWTGAVIQSEMGDVTVERASETPAAVSIYWQYTEDLSKVTASDNRSIQIKRSYYKIVPGEKSEKGVSVSHYNIGDKIKVVLTFTIDRAMDFVHIKDLRPAGFSPVSTMSGYSWSDGLSYYQSTKDAAMNYFITHINKGTYSLSYEVYATHSGSFNSGMASIQSFYTPSFVAHSKSISIEIE